MDARFLTFAAFLSAVVALPALFVLYIAARKRRRRARLVARAAEIFETAADAVRWLRHPVEGGSLTPLDLAADRSTPATSKNSGDRENS